MYERMLDKQNKPTVEQMAEYCSDAKSFFTDFAQLLADTASCQITFPYGNKYGWCIAARHGKKLLCNLFAEKNSICLMLRLTASQLKQCEENASDYLLNYLRNAYPCSDGGWIHCRMTNEAQRTEIADLYRATKLS